MIGERLRAVGGKVSIAVAISIGVAVPVNADLHDLLHRVDDALYAAKAGGRNRMVLAASTVEPCHLRPSPWFQQQ